MSRFLDYLYIAATIGFTVYGQMVLKWRIVKYGAFPVDPIDKIKFLGSLFLDPGILSGLAAGFLASLAWMAAMTKFELNHAYPFMSLNFAIVLILSGWLLHEPVTAGRVLGVMLIIAGTVVAARA